MNIQLPEGEFAAYIFDCDGTLADTMPVAVASGGKREIVTKILDALGILGKFRAIVTVEDYRWGQPAPHPFWEAARQLGVPPERCLVFEDTTPGIAGARAANMQWVLVKPPVPRK